jgi:hypothetical protein
MMQIVSAGGGIGLLDPLVHTPAAVFEMLLEAHAGSLIFTCFACLAALELVRSSTGLALHFARFGLAVSVVAIAATLHYGDFLAAPAKAAISAIMDKQPAAIQQTAFITTLSLVTAGAVYQAGKAKVKVSRAPYRSAPHAWRATSKPHERPAERGGRLVDLSLADRLLVRQMNCSRPVRTVRVPKRMQTYQAVRTWS